MNIFGLVIYLQNVFKISCKDVIKVCSRHLQDVFKMSSRCTTEDKLVFLTSLQDIFKMSSRRLKDVCKTYHSRKIDVVKFSTTDFQRCIAKKTTIYRNIQVGHTFWKVYDHNFLIVNLFDIQKLSELFSRTLYVMTVFTN